MKSVEDAGFISNERIMNPRKIKGVLARNTKIKDRNVSYLVFLDQKILTFKNSNFWK